MRWLFPLGALLYQQFTIAFKLESRDDTVPPLSPDAIVNFTLADTKLSVPLVPALFGATLDTFQYGAFIRFDTQDGCTPISYTPNPQLVESQLAQKGIHTKKASNRVTVSHKVHYLAMLPRGKCSFEIKAFHAQKAGFQSVIVYNTPSFRDVPVRMASSSLHDLTIQSFFLTYSDDIQVQMAMLHRNPLHHAKQRRSIENTGEQVDSPLADMVNMLLHQEDEEQQPWMLMQLAPKWNWEQGNSTWQFNKTSRSITTLPDILWLVSMICIVFPLSMMLGKLLGFFVVSTATRRRRQGAGGMDDEFEMKQTLQSVNHLPLKVLSEHDFRRKSSVISPTSPPHESLPESEQDPEQCALLTLTGHLNVQGADCCAICIDEFVVGSCVRQLPCKHIFHNTCVDPWLTQQRNFCPTCKRKVEEPLAKKEQKVWYQFYQKLWPF